MRTTFIALLILLSASSPHAAHARFDDVPTDHPHASAIHYVQQEGIVAGYQDGSYKPQQRINRVEFLKILIEAQLPDSPECRRLFPYTDVEWSAWYGPYLQVASCLGIVEGYDDGTFRPDTHLNYAEAAKMISGVYAFEVLPGDPWYQPYIDALYERSATPRASMLPSDLLTRGEMAEIIYRLSESGTSDSTIHSNVVADDRMLLVLSAPSVHDEYYQDDFEAIVAFQKHYARTVLGNDNIVILVDESTLPYFADDLPRDILLVADVEDIWMRDFSTILPEEMLQFRYYPAYWDDPADGEYVQEAFTNFLTSLGLSVPYHDYILDGGNVVDNGNDALIVTDRFLADNELGKEEAKMLLEEITGADVAIIPADDEVMGHSDGMVMWVEEGTLLLNEYDEPLRGQVLAELRESFPDTAIVEVPADFELTQWRNFNSACGVNLNSVVTYNHIYTPTFANTSADAAALNIIRANTSKTVHTIPAESVCHMGGSVRCVAWQVTGDMAKTLIEAAR